MSRSTRKRMIVVSAIVLVILLVVAVILSRTFGLGFVQTVIVAETMVTLVAIALGGVFALYKLEVFRDFQPHLTITQEATHRKLGDNHIHVSVTATLSNNSKVAIEIRQAEFRIQQISPFDDEEIHSLHENFIGKPNSEKYFPFPSILEYCREWEAHELTIEPGEAETEVYEFIVRDEFDTVSVDSFFVDATNSTDTKNSKGWAATSVYDIR